MLTGFDDRSPVFCFLLLLEKYLGEIQCPLLCEIPFFRDGQTFVTGAVNVCIR